MKVKTYSGNCSNSPEFCDVKCTAVVVSVSVWCLNILSILFLQHILPQISGHMLKFVPVLNYVFHFENAISNPALRIVFMPYIWIFITCSLEYLCSIYWGSSVIQLVVQYYSLWIMVPPAFKRGNCLMVVFSVSFYFHPSKSSSVTQSSL